MKEEKIQILNEENQPIYKKQITLAAEDNDDATTKSDGKSKLKKQLSVDSNEVKSSKMFEGDDLERMSPEFKSRSKLAVKDHDLKQIEKRVRTHIQKNQRKNINGK